MLEAAVSPPVVDVVVSAMVAAVLEAGTAVDGCGTLSPSMAFAVSSRTSAVLPRTEDAVSLSSPMSEKNYSDRSLKDLGSVHSLEAIFKTNCNEVYTMKGICRSKTSMNSASSSPPIPLSVDNAHGDINVVHHCCK